jgi:DNA (cytosine-5)-methyltransferase 1
VIERPIEAFSAADVLAVARLEPGECDLLAAGPPCQGFSVQRRGSDDDPRNRLVLEFLRFVEDIRPRFYLMENVPGLLSKRGLPLLEEIRTRTEALGYRTQATKLDAVHYGVPQFRLRAILIGEQVDHGRPGFVWPEPEFDARKWLTVGDAIGDLPPPPADGSPHPDVPNHYREAKLSAINLERLRHIPPGGGRECLPKHLQLPCHRNNPKHRHLDVYGRLEWDRPSGTLTARFDSFTRGKFAHPEEHRSITLREGARLQTFPDWFVFHGNREECAKQIGNAVPPRLAQAIGGRIAAALADHRAAADSREIRRSA